MHRLMPVQKTIEPEPFILELAAIPMKVSHDRTERDLKVLTKHFFLRFFDNETISLGEKKLKYFIQFLCGISLPGLIFALYIIPYYFDFLPFWHRRSYWGQTGDHYFYIVFSMIVMGMVTVLEWDLLFLDSLDILVLGAMPTPPQKILFAKSLALLMFLGTAFAAANLPGILGYTLLTNPDFLFHCMFAQTIAVMLGGAFAVTVFLSLQGCILTFFGAGAFRKVSPILQTCSLILLFIVLFLTPALWGHLSAILSSGSKAVFYFPPFWFLGVYQTLLKTPNALPVFRQLATIGLFCTLITTIIAVASYPLAYRRKARQIIEGDLRKQTRRWLRNRIDKALNASYLQTSRQRAIYHFLSQTLSRLPKQRIHLAIHAGFGLALVISTVLAFRVSPGKITPVFSPMGLRASIPILAFWLLAGLRMSFQSPVNTKASWIFKFIDPRPNLDYAAGLERWVLLRIVVLTTSIAFFSGILSPLALSSAQSIAVQIFAAVAGCVVLAKIFFYRSWIPPFSIAQAKQRKDLVWMLSIYVFIFPSFVWRVTSCERRMEMDFGYFVKMSVYVFLAVGIIEFLRRRAIRRELDWNEAEEEEGSDAPFQRLGLSS